MAVSAQIAPGTVRTRRWVRHKKYWYLTSLFLPLTPLVTGALAMTFDQGAWLWAVAPLVYIVLPVLDKLCGQDDANPAEDQMEVLKKDRYYARLLFAATAMHWAALIGLSYVVSHGHWRWINIVGAGISAGFINGVGIAIGHELGHKLNDRRQVLSAKLVLACCGYGHFMVEHNKGHHKDVATPEDPASARFGENLYRFACREIPGALRRSLDMEAQRLRRSGKAWWSPRNEILQQWAFTVVVYAVMVICWGTVLVPFLLIGAAFGWWQLTSANYVEHYGLLRQKDAGGRYLRCEPCHSWNSNFKVSNLVLVHLQRHSDHHAYPNRPYQVLRDYADVPQLPLGYFSMFTLAMFPPLWFGVMDKRVVQWARGDMRLVNVDPRRTAELFARYHAPQVE